MDLEDEAVARGEGQSGDLGQRVGTRLKNYEQHADGAGHLLQHQALRNLQPAEHLFRV